MTLRSLRDRRPLRPHRTPRPGRGDTWLHGTSRVAPRVTGSPSAPIVGSALFPPLGQVLNLCLCTLSLEKGAPKTECTPCRVAPAFTLATRLSATACWACCAHLPGCTSHRLAVAPPAPEGSPLCCGALRRRLVVWVRLSTHAHSAASSVACSQRGTHRAARGTVSTAGSWRANSEARRPAAPLRGGCSTGARKPGTQTPRLPPPSTRAWCHTDTTTAARMRAKRWALLRMC